MNTSQGRSTPNLPEQIYDTIWSRGPIPILEIVDAFGDKTSDTIFHLARLKEKGAISYDRRRGYTVRDPRQRKLKDWYASRGL